MIEVQTVIDSDIIIAKEIGMITKICAIFHPFYDFSIRNMKYYMCRFQIT